ncbi:MAG: S8 family serine peptidase [bacterium]|nr:S8 family serine peptidase [bacterium]
MLLLLCAAGMSRADHAPNELIVKLRLPVERSALDGQLRTQSAAVNQLITDAAIMPLAQFSRLLPRCDQVVKLAISSGSDLAALAAELQADPQVEWIAFNNHYRTVNTLDDGYLPNDELRGEAWWLRMISASEAWQLSRGDSNIIIGIIDTGTDYTHRDLRDNLWHNPHEIPENGIDDDNNGFIDDTIGWDFVDAPSLPAGGDYLERDSDPMDDFGHGTYVAGCASAVSDNGVCYPSIGFNCSVMTLRAGNINGTLEEDDIAAAVLYGVANGAKIINMSFGDVVASPLLREVVQIAHSAGVVLTASAGNRVQNDIHYPSGFPEVIAVGATDSLDRKASFSNYGPSVDLFAPGDYINSTILGGECGAWTFPSGTSYAAPIVAGVVGLMLTVNSSLLPDDVLNILQSTAEDINRDGWDSTTANGRVNAARAVESAAIGAPAYARLISPRTDTGVRGTFAVIGEASGTAFNRYELEYGLGENPLVWNFVAEGDSRVFGDTLGLIFAPFADTVLIARLTSYATTGQQSVVTNHVYVQNSSPAIDSLISRNVLDGAGFGQQILAWTNQFSRASLLMTNSAGDSIREDFGYVSDEHVAVISQTRYAGEWTAVLQVTNLLGESTRSASFEYSSTQSSIRPFLFTRAESNLPHGILGTFFSDYNCNARPEVWIMPVDENSIVDTLEPFEWNGTSFVATGNMYGIHIPTDYGDADGDGLFEIIGRRSIETRIWEQSTTCGVHDNLVFNGPDHFDTFIASKFVTLDSASGRDDILARTQTNNGQRFALYSVSQNYEVTLRDTLPNLTGGANALGAPGSAALDIDRDGRLDIFYGDYDGDVIWCEWTGSGVTQVKSLRLRQNDVTNWFAAGDVDGDGADELVVGCRSNGGYSSESERLLQGWDYYIFESPSDNELIAVDSIAILGNENVSAQPASVAITQLDDDAALEIAISAYPDLYIVSFDESSGRYLPEWHYLPNSAGGMVASDFNGNGVAELLASDGTHQLRMENAEASGDAPLPPLLSGEAINETEVHLFWTPVSGAIHYEVYRSIHSEPLEFFHVTEATELSPYAPEDVIHDYAVVTYDTAFAQQVSVLSNVVAIAANTPPIFERLVEWTAPQIISVGFNEPMGTSVFVQGNWRLGDGSMPAVITEGENRRRVFLSFDNPFIAGHYEMRLGAIRDAQGTLLPDAERHLQFTLVDTTGAVCHVIRHELLDAPVGSHVQLEYSEPMSLTVLDLSNYVVHDPRLLNVTYAARAVRAMNTDRSIVEIELDERYPAGAVGVNVRIQLVNLTSETGDPLSDTDIVLGEAALNLADTYVYPNPFRGRGAAGSAGVFFAALPPRAMIRIFAVDGSLLKEIEHDNPSGHASWDLRTDKGEEIASGVYLFTVESNGEEKAGKFAVIR